MCNKPSHSFQSQALILDHFQDLPTGYESVNYNERVGEEVVSSSQEAEEEEQEAVVTFNPDGEVRNQHRVCCWLDHVLNLLLWQAQIEMVPLSELHPVEA